MNVRLAPLFALIALLPNLSQANDIELVLRLREKVSMEKLAADVTNPSSLRYNQFYTPDEIRAIAGPSDFDYAQTLKSLQDKGLTVVGEDKTHLWVTVKASQDVVERAFSTKLEFVDATRHTALQEAIVPADLEDVVSVVGLDNTRMNRPHYAINPKSLIPASKENAAAGGDQTAGYMPDTVKTIYGFDPIYKGGISGKGQHIAIATYDMYHTQDPELFWPARWINPAPSFDNVFFNGTPNINDDSCMETELDIEFSGMMAPGASIHVFPSAHNDDPGEVQLFTAILDDNRAKVVNYSWGDCEANVTAQHFADMNQVFARAVAQGVNVLPAAGDWGSFGCPSSSRGTPGKVNADWPAANPYVVAVGGTYIDGTDGTGAKEGAWDDTGGGVSVVFDRPSWQAGFADPFVKRSFPDVAFNSDPNTGEGALVHYNNQQMWLVFGGTSIAAPQWSGFLALVGEGRGAKGPLGYLNPIIYKMTDAERATTFSDTTKGNNGAYKAGPGWDATTGWGSMRAAGLYQYLVAH